MSYFKYVLKGFKENFSRFIAIISIITLGIGFLVGLSTASVDIRKSVDNMYSETNVQDFNLKSTIGFSKDSIAKLEGSNLFVEGALQREPDSTTLDGRKVKPRQIIAPINESKINKLTLKEGRFPENKYEVVVLEDMGVYKPAKIGDTISIDDQKAKIKENYEVVGIVSSPLYFSKDSEHNLTGTDRLDLIFFSDLEYEEVDYYTDINIHYNDIDEYRFEDAYFDKLDPRESELENKEEDLINDRLEEIRETISTEAYKVAEAELRETVSNNPMVPPSMIDETVKSIMATQDFKDTVEPKIDEQLDKFKEDKTLEVYVLDLKSNMSYVTLEQNTSKVDKISLIFPVFFYFIAALVSLTTITRLVDEERGNIGLLKSLGYSKAKITSKYLVYGLTCSIIGCGLGNLAGVYLLPFVIFKAFESIYVLPNIVFDPGSIINFVSIAVMAVMIIGVTLFVTRKSLKERPAALLQPKAPKPGKRILLERCKFVWNRVKFKHKNTIRNIFRYKKNLIMMIIGIGGCVGLLLCAFGIKDAFSDLTSSQYENIVQYNLRLSVDNDEDIDLSTIAGIKSYSGINNKEVHIEDDKNYNIKKIETNEDINTYFTFKNGGKTLEFKEGDVFIDEQIAEAFKLHKGDKITFKETPDIEYEITGIFENHVNNYCFVYTSEVENVNNFLIILEDGVDESSVVEALKLDSVTGIERISQIKDSFNSMFGSVTMIIVVAIVCSGALAVIVIYNLTNININERIKEIATLKVLGYQNREVYGYIYREILIMSLMGILFGFLLGPLLYRFVIFNVQSPGTYFTYSIDPYNFLWSFLFTLLFVAIVDILFIKKIKNIKMVESLKCVD